MGPPLGSGGGCPGRDSLGLSFQGCHTPSGGTRPPTHLVQQHIGVRQQIVRLRAEAARWVQGLRLKDRPLVRAAAGRTPRRTAADVVP